MGLHDPIGWLDVEEIAERLHEAHPAVDPLTLRFTALRALVEALPGFEADPDHPVNEKILETIQMLWHGLRSGTKRDD
ncbi:MAG: Fe-S cluster assembly protein IscX [Phycisphaeraceae bacterium]|nr:Fe-S cluster assembly protein IscX [Phycisphaeraceae bacterium]